MRVDPASIGGSIATLAVTDPNELPDHSPSGATRRRIARFEAIAEAGLRRDTERRPRHAPVPAAVT